MNHFVFLSLSTIKTIIFNGNTVQQFHSSHLIYIHKSPPSNQQTKQWKYGPPYPRSASLAVVYLLTIQLGYLIKEKLQTLIIMITSSYLYLSITRYTVACMMWHPLLNKNYLLWNHNGDLNKIVEQFKMSDPNWSIRGNTWSPAQTRTPSLRND